MKIKKKGIVFVTMLALASIFSAYSFLVEKQSEEKTAVKKVEAAASVDTPLFIACYDGATNAFKDTTIAIEYYWDNYSRSVKADIIGNQIRSVTLPAGTKGFNLYRMKNDKAGYLPYDGAPGSSDYYNSYNYTFSTSWNMVVFTDSSLNRTTTTCSRPILKKGSVITFNAKAFGDWFSNNASPSIYTFCNNFYGTWAWWNNMVRIGDTQYMRFTADINYVVDGFIITRDNPSGSRGTGSHNWSDNSAIWNRTTDITIMQTGGLVSVLNTKTGDNYNWQGTTTDADYAEMWGGVFMSYITCSGTGSVTSTTDDWTTTANEYNSLTTSQQGIIYDSTGSISDSSYLKRAVYRYDYIVFYKKYSGYSDYIGRDDSDGRSFAIGSFSPFEMVLGDSENNLPTIIIIIASSISLLSITALSVLVIKKRKNEGE